jgi:hypothetical protein
LANNRIVAVLDWQRTWPAWLALARWMLVSFWSGFGGIQPGLTSAQMIPLGLLTALAAMGIVRILLRDFPLHFKPFDSDGGRHGFGLLVLTGAATVVLLLYRSDLVVYSPEILIWSSTRHGSAGYIALSALIALGSLHWIPRHWQRIGVAAGLAALFLLNTYILLKVQYPFQHCELPIQTDCLSTIH